MAGRNFAINSAILIVLVMIIVSGTVYMIDPASFQRLDNIPIKLIAIIFCGLLMLVVLVQLAMWFYFPTPIRNALSNVRLCRFAGFVGGVAPMGLFGMQTFMLDHTSLNISFTEAGVSTSVTLLISFIALHYFSKEYKALWPPP